MKMEKNFRETVSSIFEYQEGGDIIFSIYLQIAYFVKDFRINFCSQMELDTKENSVSNFKRQNILTPFIDMSIIYFLPWFTR